IDQGLSRLPQTCEAGDQKPAAAEIISPPNGATLESTAVTFTWTSGTAIQDYKILVGTSPDGGDLLTTGYIQNTSASVNLPDRPGDVYVTLWSRPKDGSRLAPSVARYKWPGPAAIDLSGAETHQSSGTFGPAPGTNIVTNTEPDPHWYVQWKTPVRTGSASVSWGQMLDMDWIAA